MKIIWVKIIYQLGPYYYRLAFINENESKTRRWQNVIYRLSTGYSLPWNMGDRSPTPDALLYCMPPFTSRKRYGVGSMPGTPNKEADGYLIRWFHGLKPRQLYSWRLVPGNRTARLESLDQAMNRENVLTFRKCKWA